MGKYELSTRRLSFILKKSYLSLGEEHSSFSPLRKRELDVLLGIHGTTGHACQSTHLWRHSSHAATWTSHKTWDWKYRSWNHLLRNLLYTHNILKQILDPWPETNTNQCLQTSNQGLSNEHVDWKFYKWWNCETKVEVIIHMSVMPQNQFRMQHYCKKAENCITKHVNYNL